MSEGVTFAAGVPTVWLALIEYIEANGLTLGGLARVLVGGAAMPERLLRRFDALGIAACHAWGMTELSPIGTVGMPTAAVAAMPVEAQRPYRMKQGRPPCGVEMRIIDEGGAALPHDGQAMGLLQVRGPAVASGYFGGGLSALDEAGWFDTGDVATIDGEGFMQITDRAKDVIKSGGEWISSIEIENAALLHPHVALAAVVGVPHPTWDERPVLLVTTAPGEGLAAAALLDHLRDRIPRWWLPETVLFLDEMPLGATGKIDKRGLRADLIGRGVIGGI